MYNNNIDSATSSWALSSNHYSQSESADASAFSTLFDSIRNGGSRKNIQSILDDLSSRFPSLNITRSTAASKTQTTGETEAQASGESTDTATIDESALEEMSSSETFAELVRKAISSFLDATRNAFSGGGAYAQRSISVSVTTIRFTLSGMDSASGETLTSQELQAVLSEKIGETIKNLFGSADESDDASEKDDKTSSDSSRLEIGGWSMQLYYSRMYIMGGQNGGSMQGWGGSISMQGITGSLIPAALSDILAGTSGTSSLRDALSSHGIGMSGYSASQFGFLLNLAQDRDPLTSLLESLTGQYAAAIAAPAVDNRQNEGSAAETAAVGAVAGL